MGCQFDTTKKKERNEQNEKETYFNDVEPCNGVKPCGNKCHGGRCELVEHSETSMHDK